MPTRRKKQTSKAKTPSKAKSPAKAETTKKPRLAVTSVQEVYDACRQDHTKLRNQEQAGVLATLVWPTLVQFHESTKQKTKKEMAEWDVGCRLAALLVSFAHGLEGGGGGIGGTQDPLSMVDKAEVLEKMLETLLGTIESDEAQLASEALGFVTCALASDRQEVQTACQKFVPSILLWHAVPERRRELELRLNAGLRRKFSATEAPASPGWIVSWMDRFLELLTKTKEEVEDSNQEEDDEEEAMELENETPKAAPLHTTEETLFLHRSLDLLLDLLSTGVTRQHLVSYLEAIQFVVRVRLATAHHSLDALTLQLLQRTYDSLAFPLRGAHTSLTKTEVLSLYHARANTLQKLCHAHYSQQLPEVIHAGVGLLCNGTYLKTALGGLTEEQLQDIVYRLRLVEKHETSRDYCLAVLLHYVTLPSYPLEKLKSFPLYPTETLLWNPHVIPSGTSWNVGETTAALALPKLQKQFLSYADYLLRNFELMRLESAYEIRSDLVHAMKRVKPVIRQQAGDDEHETTTTEFRGWARMALELQQQVRIVRVAPPKLGEGHPAQVIAELTLDLEPCGQAIRREWDELGEYDNLFLVGVDASQMSGEPAPLVGGSDSDRRVPDEEDSTFPQRFGVIAVRGGMILQVKDEDGNLLSDQANRGPGTQRKEPATTKRIFRVALDPVQYARDARSKIGTELYQCLNLVVRRHGRENNFKSVLETIRGLAEGSGSISRVIPQWLQPLLLGYGSPDSASYKSDIMQSYATKTPGVTKPDAALDYGDTFLDEQHLRDCFPGSKVIIDGEESPSKADESRRNYRIKVTNVNDAQLVEATSYPFPANFSGNPVHFTPVQVEAIRSGLSIGLTTIVGPPGTGKTDVAVQIIAGLYHSFPTQRTVIITHSNAALNDIFTKVMARGDIDERYMIRLGSGERDLNSDSSHDFTKTGRVAYLLDRRNLLLEQVQLLSEALGISGKAERGLDGSPSYTCETAQYFNKHYVQKHVKSFQKQAALKEASSVGTHFPFKSYFGLSDEDAASLTLEQANEKISELDQIFSELSEYRPLELLRSQRQRTDYLLMKQAKIVAMTCTYAAIARSHLIELGFEYDNVLMEEAGQMMEVETFIPLLLQKGETDEKASGLTRLKRICLIGDHHQLPPVVKNASFSKYCNLDQSMFSRLVRLGVPYIQLNRQGRARPEIAQLYSWRYMDLGSLDHVSTSDKFQVANTGFAHPYQMINVEDFEGRGESTPTAYFYQNVGEAEYAVALFQYMVLIGYPPEKISLLTTYNGQKELLQDIVSQRCGEGTPLAGVRPKAVSTVDQYQGQQNDYIILSLVRTSSVGHLRDIRRLVVAVSRSRLGLYVLCRQKLFADCHELKQTMEQFEERPHQLELVLGEHYPTERKLGDALPKKKVFPVEDVAHLGAMVHSMQEKWLADAEEGK